MSRSFELCVRVVAYVALLAGGAVALGYGAADANAQQAPDVKCYLMVCTGTICVARQIECPPGTTPIAPSTDG